jgi:DNA-binding NarL/FixJ family response regulator
VGDSSRRGAPCPHLALSDSNDVASGSDRRIRVAIVDDHSVTAEGLARIFSSENDLELAGTAATIAEALTLIKREIPKVVLMDYLLPDGNGADATEQILQHWPDTKILMLSGSEEPEVLTRAFEAGCVGFIAKSRPWSEIVSAVRAASRGESVMRADELAGLLNRLKSTTNEQAQGLTSRELEILRLLAKARSTDAIAADLFLSTHTVRNHVSNILTKLGAHSKLEAVGIAVRDRIISSDEFK